jgi:hypothetical protein
MVCVSCKRAAPIRTCTEETLTRRGWYFWPMGGPVRYEGLVLCPDCRRGPVPEMLIRCAEEDSR